MHKRGAKNKVTNPTHIQRNGQCTLTVLHAHLSFARPHCTQGWKRRYCEIVGNQTLEYYAAQGGKAIGSFNLAGCEVAAEEDTKLTLGKEHCFSIRIGSVSRVFEAPTAKLCSKWIKALKRAAKASVLLQGPLEKKGQWRKVRGLF